MTAPIRTEAEPGTGASIAAAAVEKGPGDLSYVDFHSMTYIYDRNGPSKWLIVKSLIGLSPDP